MGVQTATDGRITRAEVRDHLGCSAGTLESYEKAGLCWPIDDGPRNGHDTRARTYDAVGLAVAEVMHQVRTFGMSPSALSTWAVRLDEQLREVAAGGPWSGHVLLQDAPTTVRLIPFGALVREFAIQEPTGGMLATVRVRALP